MSHEIQRSNYQPSVPEDAYTAARRNYGEALMEERIYREEQAGWGSLDLLIAAKGSMVSVTIGEVLQNEHDEAVEQKRELEAMLPDADIGSSLAYDPDSTPSSAFEFIAQAPVDMKAFGVAVGAFALVSAAHRIRRAERFPRDAEAAVAQAERADAFIPAGPEERKRHRLGRRLADAALTGVATVATYQAAKYGSQSQDIIAAGALNVAAVGSVYGSKLRTKMAVNKFRQERAARFVNPAELE